VGRPSDYTEEIGDEICLEIATTDKSLETICESKPEFPCARTVYRWIIASSELPNLPYGILRI
jgi:hypothetical protein